MNYRDPPLTHDIPLPRLLPWKVEGWKGLADHLGMIGIRISANALEIRHRRRGLPVHGGRVQGRPVFFTKDDVDVWVRYLTGKSRAAWGRSPEAAGRRPWTPPRASPGRARERAILPDFPLYTVLVPSMTRGEQVHRSPDGYLHAALEPSVFEDLFHGGDPPPGQWRTCLFHRSRRATEADLRPMSPQQRKRTPKPAARLVGAFTSSGRTLRWIQVPGTFFGLAEAAWTPLLTSRALPRFGEAVTWILTHIDAPTFITWTRPVPVRPVTLEEVPAREWNALPDLMPGHPRSHDRAQWPA